MIQLEFMVTFSDGDVEGFPRCVELSKDSWAEFAVQFTKLIGVPAENYDPFFKGKKVNVASTLPSSFRTQNNKIHLQVRERTRLVRHVSPTTARSFSPRPSPPLSPRSSRSSRSVSSRVQRLGFVLYPHSFTSSELLVESLNASDAGRSNTLAERVVLRTTNPVSVELPEAILRECKLEAFKTTTDPDAYIAPGGTVSPNFETIADMFESAECSVFNCDNPNYHYQASIHDGHKHTRTLTSRSDFALLPVDHKLPPRPSRDMLAEVAFAWIEVSSGNKTMKKASVQLTAHLKCLQVTYGFKTSFGIVLSKDLKAARLIRMVGGNAEHDGYYPAPATKSIVQAIHAWYT